MLQFFKMLAALMFPSEVGHPVSNLPMNREQCRAMKHNRGM